MFRVLLTVQILLLCLSAAACGGTETPESRANSNARATPPPRECSPTTDTPTEAYKRLYAAVKEKNTESIKSQVSKASQELADSLAERQKNPIEKVYENGFTATTFSPTLPTIRDERVKGCWGGVEVRNTKDNRWEDLPFVNEDGGWKFAIGELFSGEYESPGKGMAEKEMEATNSSTGNAAMPSYPSSNTNANTPAATKYDGPEVERLPRNK